ncbi:TetR/AcrR family transcriptional regulator [Microbacterium panaciterrae]|uniref:HTH tetR-type domain-containing protein n=1 Tax=Microbacterium panaciterrae TaxID=985759 RepID=A0ABP8P168_9MICO
MTSGSEAGATRSRLLAAAADEIIQRGYSGASLSRIGERIGLTKGAFSRHFPTKDTLVDAIAERSAEASSGVLAAAEAAFPSSPIRSCILVIGGLAASARTDPVLAAAVLLFQDPSVDTARIAPFRATLAEMLLTCLRGAVAREGYTLTMSLDDSVQFIIVVLTGILSSLRFADTYEPHQEPLFVQAMLIGIGIPDAAEVISDAMRLLGG